jgi:molybdopterin-containing oxidoreductase family iron-sulfur binding subunit
MLDENSAISKLLSVEKEGRAFHVLEEINVQPQISYLAKIRNKDEAKKKAEGAAHAEHKEHA